MKRIVLICAVMLIAAGCTSGADKLSSLKLSKSSVTLSVGETFQLTVTTNLDDPAVRITWGSSDNAVATVDKSGMITGIGTGTAVITASSGTYRDTCSVTVEETSGPAGPLDATAALATGADAGIIYSKDVLQYNTTRIMQGFDIVSNGNIYYSQMNSSTAVNICRAAGPNLNTTEYMRLNNFGHGTQIVAEEAAGGRVYIWVNSNGTVDTNGESVNNRSFSRVEFKAGATYSNYAGDTFILNKGGQMDQQVAIDFTARRLLVGSRESGIRYFWVFDLDEAISLPLKTMKVSLKESVSGSTVTRSLEARDLNDCTVLASFALPPGTNKATDVWSYSHQGHELHGDYVYFYEGEVETLAADSFRSKAFVTVFDLEGKIAVPRTEAAVIADLAGLKATGLTTTGYAEAEGVKVKDGKLYIGAACRNNSSSDRRAIIFVYNCVRKQ